MSRTYLVAKATKTRHYVTLAPVKYDKGRAIAAYANLRKTGAVDKLTQFWARDVARQLLRLEHAPDFFTSEGQHKMEASNRARLQGIVPSHLRPWFYLRRYRRQNQENTNVF